MSKKQPRDAKGRFLRSYKGVPEHPRYPSKPTQAGKPARPTRPVPTSEFLRMKRIEQALADLQTGMTGDTQAQQRATATFGPVAF